MLLRINKTLDVHFLEEVSLRSIRSMHIHAYMHKTQIHQELKNELRFLDARDLHKSIMEGPCLYWVNWI